MKLLIGIFKNRWIISILGLVAVSVLIWFVGPYIAIAGFVPLQTIVARLIAIMICMLIWGLNNLRVQMSVNKANSDLVDVVADEPVTGSQSSARSTEEIALLKSRFEDALQTLRKTSQRRGG